MAVARGNPRHRTRLTGPLTSTLSSNSLQTVNRDSTRLALSRLRDVNLLRPAADAVHWNWAPVFVGSHSPASSTLRGEDCIMSKFTNQSVPPYRVVLLDNAAQALLFVVRSVMEITHLYRDEATHKMW